MPKPGQPDDAVRIDREARVYRPRKGQAVTFEAAHVMAVAAATALRRPDLTPPPRLGTRRAFRAYTRALQASREAFGLPVNPPATKSLHKL